MARRGRPPHPEALTPREQDVARLVAQGLTNAEIAAELGITAQGVRYHLNQIYAKHQLGSRDELARWFAEGGPTQQRRFARLGLPLLPFGLTATVVAPVIGLSALAVVSLALVAPWPRDDEDPGAAAELPGYACTIESPLVAESAETRCFDTLEELTAELPMALMLPSADMGDGTTFALVRSHAGDAAYIAYEAAGETAETIQGAVEAPWVDSLTPPELWPLVARGAGEGAYLDGFVQLTDDGSVAWWCPAGRWINVAGLACVADLTFGVHGLSGAELERLVQRYAIDQARQDRMATGSEMAPATPDSEPTPVPFPEPRGETVEPLVSGIPGFPNAHEIDGFLAPESDFEPPQAVQMFHTEALPEEVFAHFASELEAGGWHDEHGSRGISGQSITWSRDGGREWITIATHFQVLPGEDMPEPPPGFRGKGVPFDLYQDSITRFWVVTWVEE